MAATPLVAPPELQGRVLRAVAEPSRLRILDTLREGEQRVVDVVDATGLSQPNVSKHLACLHDCGLVARDKRGREVFYATVEGVDELLRALDTLTDQVGEAVAACSDGC